MNERTFNGHTFDPGIINYPQVAANASASFCLVQLHFPACRNPPVSLTPVTQPRDPFEFTRTRAIAGIRFDAASLLERRSFGSGLRHSIHLDFPKKLIKLITKEPRNYY